MPARCVAANCGNVKDVTRNISLHLIPFYGDTKPEAVKRRKKWVDWVKLKRAKWEPSKHSHLCSIHFKDTDFLRQYGSEVSLTNRQLLRDDIGVCVFPCIHAGANKEKPLSERDRRMTMKTLMSRQASDINIAEGQPSCKAVKLSGAGSSSTCSTPVVFPSTSSTALEVEPSNTPVESLPSTSSLAAEVEPSLVPFAAEPEDLELPATSNESQPSEKTVPGLPVQNEPCSNCAVLKNEKRMLQNRILTLQGHLSKQKGANKKHRRRSKIVEPVPDKDKSEDDGTTAPEVQKNDEDENEDVDELEEEEYEEEEEEDLYEIETDGTETTETESDEDDVEKSNWLPLKDTNIRTEPKHIVFLTKLLLLFRFCFTCKADNPRVETREVGTEVIVKTTCINPKCLKENVWYSQPLLPNSKIPAGNFLLCMGTLLSGGSVTKIFRVFRHMGLGCVSINTFFKYQRTKLFPVIYLYWQKYQAKLLAKVKAFQGDIAIAGDGRHDSMGHRAKFGAYTMFCCTIPMIIHFALVQRNEAGSSTGMEFMAFERCMEYLIAYGIVIKYFISDRHIKIGSHMSTVYENIRHYFDIWHLKKKIRKVLSNIAKLKGCEVLWEWIKPCERHLYWSATSTFDGDGQVIWDKFRTFLKHVINIHSGFKNTSFSKCSHGNLEPRKWLKAATPVYERLCAALTNNSLMKGIKKASPLAQTSCLEGFHSVLNYFAPKMIAYSYVGMYCRHILAAVHFNFNLQRDVKQREVDGVERVKISYPKFKNGEATVRNVKVQQNFEYVEEIFQTFMCASKDELLDASTKLHEMTPAAMNTMLEKQSRAEALQKRDQRSKMVVKDVPPTTPVSEVYETPEQEANRQKEKTTRRCRECKEPLKGHKNVAHCPRNRQQK